MKEITRRLYTKPVMLSMALLMGVALVVGLLVTTRKSSAAPSAFPIVADNDVFETPGNGETVHDFGGSPIPANFFGPGSQPYNQPVQLEGVPLSGDSDVDTIIQRHQTITGPGGSTQLTMTALSLKSSNPITVTYSSGASEAWNLKVGLSQFKTSTGTMTVYATTMDSTLKVWPRFVLTRVSDGLTRVFDTGSGAGLTAATTSAKSSKTAATTVEPGDGGTVIIEPAPLPQPCKVAVIDDSRINPAAAAAAASSSCAPVTLSCTSPWFPCGAGGICFPPLTEAERWARHNAWPKGTKKGGGVAVGE
jgi:hypothetical protein